LNDNYIKLMDTASPGARVCSQVTGFIVRNCWLESCLGRHEDMSENIDDEGRLGDLIVAAFDEAAQFTTDPAEASQLATRAVTHILERTRRPFPPLKAPVALDRPLSPGARRAAAAILRLVPSDGPKLRLVRPRVPLRLCPNPEAPPCPSPEAPVGSSSSRGQPGSE
jgi:hypothetical protein